MTIRHLLTLARRRLRLTVAPLAELLEALRDYRRSRAGYLADARRGCERDTEALPR